MIDYGANINSNNILYKYIWKEKLLVVIKQLNLILVTTFFNKQKIALMKCENDDSIHDYFKEASVVKHNSEN